MFLSTPVPSIISTVMWMISWVSEHACLIRYWHRYDILCLWTGTSSQLQSFLKHTNSQSPSIKFTVEVGGSSLHFFDLKNSRILWWSQRAQTKRKECHWHIYATKTRGGGDDGQTRTLCFPNRTWTQEPEEIRLGFLCQWEAYRPCHWTDIHMLGVKHWSRRDLNSESTEGGTAHRCGHG